MAEVSNTPWNEKYYYLVDINSPQPVAKSFHVSPFMEMDMTYHWQITTPAETAKIRIDNWDKKRLFTAVFSAQRKGLTKQNIRSVLARWPVQPISVIGRIYWQAFKLFLKGVRFVPYQKKSPLNQSDAK